MNHCFESKNSGFFVEDFRNYYLLRKVFASNLDILTSHLFRPGLFTVPLIVLLGIYSLLQTANAQPVTPGFTVEQATLGKAAYAISCLGCHGEDLSGGQFGTPLKGNMFLLRWGGKSADQLYIKMATTMPTAEPGSLSNETYTNLLAYMLEKNGITAGTGVLPEDPPALSNLILPAAAPREAGGITGGVTLPPPPSTKANPLDKITPVTDAMLANAPAGDWLTWRRTSDAVGFSPLSQISRQNIKNIRVAWSWALPNGPSQVSPLVHDDVIFVHGYGDHVQALDARAGDLLWQYSRWLADNLGPNEKRKRNLAIYGERLYVPTADAHVVALDVRTGEVIWDTPVGDIPSGLGMVGGPIVAKGKVMIGTTGRTPGGNFIVGLDANTGVETWRFYAIARPGEPGGNSWNGLPLEERNGASIWLPGSYDNELGLAYFGPAQTYDTGPLRDPINKPGITNDALYTDSTVALDPDTGKLVWHYQHLPNDQWDLDWAFERQLIYLPVNGEEKKVVVTAGKQAIYDVIEADTGKYVYSLDLGLQNLVTSIDAETGAKQIDPDLIPGKGKAITVCPHAGGSKNWIPGSYNPDTRILYVPLMESCMDLTPVSAGQTGSLSSGVMWSIRPPLDSDGLYGRLQAINLEKRAVEWTHRQRAPLTSGVLATAGGLVFVGDLDRKFAAYDQATGEELWHIRLNDVPNTAPFSYSVDGKQFIALTVGHGGPLSMDRAALVPEIRLPSNPGATLWVFELVD